MRIEAQIRAMRPDRSVLLTASAGSGKTHVLVRRMIHLLAAGAAPEDIVAATFSEKAAAQMEEKLYETLADAAGKGQDAGELIGLGPGDAPYPIVRAPEDILSELSARPDRLRIGTIHALCLWLLRRFPLEAGLPPDFSVMDESEIPLRRERAVDACLEAVSGGELSCEFTTLADLGYSQRTVRELIEAAFDKRPHIMKLAVDAGGPDGLIEALESVLDAHSRLATAVEFISGGGLQGKARELAVFVSRNRPAKPGYRAALEALSAVKDIDAFRYAFAKLKGYLYTKSGSPQKNTPFTLGAAKEAAKKADPALKSKSLDEAARALKSEHDMMFEALRDEAGKLALIVDYYDGAAALTAMLRLFFRAGDIYSESNRSEGLVDFDELEIRAYSLISRLGSARLLAAAESAATHYLVDEFQDTGELQWGILERLNSEAFSGKGAEGIKSPTIFAVGDKKQSIYRFRMANHRLIDRLKGRMEETIEPGGRDFPTLGHNFRSAPEILKVVDETFGGLFADEYNGSTPYRTKASGSVTLRLDPQESEAEALADTVESALGLPVWDDASKGFRPAGYGDMAVLLRSRTRLVAYEEALRDRGVPFKVVGGVGFFRQEEVRAIVGIANYLDDPADTLSLASALKSPLFGLTDGELEPFYKSGEPLTALAVISPDAHRLVSGWLRLAGTSTPGRIVEEIIEGSAAPFVFGVHGGPSALLNIEKLSGLAREFDRRGGVGLAEFTGWVRACRDSSELASADVDLPGFEDFVSIMTVHAAKGLEFPVVFIAGAGIAPLKPVGRLVVGAENPGDIGLCTDSLLGDNPVYGPLKGLEKDAREGEAKRLLYVAMTRAMDHLFILAGCKTGRDGTYKPAGGSWAGLLFDAAPQSLLPAVATDVEIPAVYRYPTGGQTSVRGLHLNPSHPRSDPSGPPAGPSERIAPLAQASGPAYVSPSGLARTTLNEADASRPYPAALRGSAIHRALESAGKTGSWDARRACERVHGFGALEHGAAAELAEDVRKTVSRLLADERMGPLFTPGEGRYFELGLLMERGGDVVYGTADLVVVEGRSAVVYDFKTGLSDVGHENIKEAYAPQLAAYCDAVRHAFGLEISSPCILLVDTAELLRL